MMETFKNIEFNEEYIECKLDLPLAILRIKEDAFKNIVNIKENSKMYEWLDNVNDTKEIKTILIITDEVALSEKKISWFSFRNIRHQA